MQTKPLTNDYDDDNHFRKPQKNRDTTTRKSANRVMSNRGPRKGIPGIDYPNFHRIPSTGFDCNEKQFPGMYADANAGCQVSQLHLAILIGQIHSNATFRASLIEDIYAFSWNHVFLKPVSFIHAVAFFFAYFLGLFIIIVTFSSSFFTA